MTRCYSDQALTPGLKSSIIYSSYYTLLVVVNLGPVMCDAYLLRTPPLKSRRIKGGNKKKIRRICNTLPPLCGRW